MMISSAGQAGLMGLQRGMEGLNRNATELANGGQMQASSARDISAPLVEQTQNLQQVEASAKVMGASDEVMGRLIDITA